MLSECSASGSRGRTARIARYSRSAWAKSPALAACAARLNSSGVAAMILAIRALRRPGRPHWGGPKSVFRVAAAIKILWWGGQRGRSRTCPQWHGAALPLDRGDEAAECRAPLVKPQFTFRRSGFQHDPGTILPMAPARE